MDQFRISYQNGGLNATIEADDPRLLHALRSAIKHYTETPVIVPIIEHNVSTMYIQFLVKQLELMPIYCEVRGARLEVKCDDAPERHIYARDITTDDDVRPWNEDTYLFTLFSGESVSISLTSEMKFDSPSLGPVGTISDGKLFLESNVCDMEPVLHKTLERINTHMFSSDILKWERASNKNFISITTPYTTVGIPYLLVLLRCVNPDLIETAHHTQKHSDGGIFHIDLIKANEKVKLKDIMDHIKKPAFLKAIKMTL